MGSCPAQTDPDTQWPHYPDFCPRPGPAYLFAVLFGLTLIAHIAQSVIYRKGYSWLIAMGALWETACYLYRTLSINRVANENDYISWSLLMLVSDETALACLENSFQSKC